MRKGDKTLLPRGLSKAVGTSGQPEGWMPNLIMTSLTNEKNVSQMLKKNIGFSIAKIYSTLTEVMG